MPVFEENIQTLHSQRSAAPLLTTIPWGSYDSETADLLLRGHVFISLCMQLASNKSQKLTSLNLLLIGGLMHEAFAGLAILL